MESDEPLTKEELMKDEYYGLILPDNKRVNDKIRKKNGGRKAQKRRRT